MAEFDVVVIGAGHNGLVAAAYLAKAGLKACVVEKRDRPGGCVASEELWPGFSISTAAYVVSLLRKEIIQDLNLQKHGYEVIVKNPAIFIPFPDGKHLFLWNDTPHTMKEIERFSKRDAHAYEGWQHFWNAFAAIAEKLMLRPPPDVDELARMVKTAKIAAWLHLTPKELINEFSRVLLMDARRLLDEYFESEELKAALVEDAVVGAFAGPSTPGTAYILAHHIMGELNGVRGAWGYVRGGMGRLAEALANSARTYNAKILLSTPVKRILVKNGKAKGIQLQDGRTLEARAVLSNADPKHTLLNLVGEEYLDENVVRKLRCLRTEGATFKIVGILKSLPRYAAYGNDALGLQHRASSLILPSIDYVERAYRDALHGMPAENPWMSINIQSAVDATVAPPNTHTLSIFVQYAPYNVKGNWDEMKTEYAEHVLDIACEYAPNLREALVGYKSYSPVDMEREFSLTQGNIFHLDMTPSQLLANRPLPGWGYQTPIEGLFLCGAGTHPGGGITGAPGYNAARAVLHHLRKHRFI